MGWVSRHYHKVRNWINNKKDDVDHTISMATADVKTNMNEKSISKLGDCISNPIKLSETVLKEIAEQSFPPAQKLTKKEKDSLNDWIFNDQDNFNLVAKLVELASSLVKDDSSKNQAKALGAANESSANFKVNKGGKFVHKYGFLLTSGYQLGIAVADLQAGQGFLFENDAASVLQLMYGEGENLGATKRMKIGFLRNMPPLEDMPIKFGWANVMIKKAKIQGKMQLVRSSAKVYPKGSEPNPGPEVSDFIGCGVEFYFNQGDETDIVGLIKAGVENPGFLGFAIVPQVGLSFESDLKGSGDFRKAGKIENIIAGAVGSFV